MFCSAAPKAKKATEKKTEEKKDEGNYTFTRKFLAGDASNDDVIVEFPSKVDSKKAKDLSLLTILYVFYTLIFIFLFYFIFILTHIYLYYRGVLQLIQKKNGGNSFGRRKSIQNHLIKKSVNLLFIQY